MTMTAPQPQSAPDRANIGDSDIYYYFIYSERQYKERTRIEASLARKFRLGTVIVNGKKQYFTELSRRPKNRYPDFKIVAEGYASQMRYIPPGAI